MMKFFLSHGFVKQGLLFHFNNLVKEIVAYYRYKYDQQSNSSYSPTHQTGGL